MEKKEQLVMSANVFFSTLESEEYLEEELKRNECGTRAVYCQDGLSCLIQYRCKKNDEFDSVSLSISDKHGKPGVDINLEECISSILGVACPDYSYVGYNDKLDPDNFHAPYAFSYYYWSSTGRKDHKEAKEMWQRAFHKGKQKDEWITPGGRLVKFLCIRGS